MTTMETGVTSGVSFALTDEQRELRALARDFAEKEIRPKAAEYDEHQTHPADVVAKAHEIGLMNLHLPESLGGPELSAFDGMLVGEELNWGVFRDRHLDPRERPRRRPDLDRRYRRAEARLARPARRGARPRVLRALRAGSGLGRLGDPDDGRAEGRRVRRQRLEDVHHERRSGVVDHLLRLDRQVERAPGPLRFVIPMDAEGVTIEKHLDKMGQRATDTSAVAFQDVVVPASNRLGAGAMGSRSRCRHSTSRAPVRPSARWASRRPAYELSVDYAKERVQFGMPIAMNQGVSFLVSDMATEIEAARLPDLAGGVDARPGLGPQGDEVLIVREALRRRHRDEGHHRCRPDLRRLRLHQGVPSRDALRREAFPDLRGHLASSGW